MIARGSALFGVMLLSTGICQAHVQITTDLNWSRDIAPLFARHCTGCHRPRGAAFSLEHFAEARAWAKAIRDEVESRHMPPWPAAPGVGAFKNDRSLPIGAVAMIVAWVEGGAPERAPGSSEESTRALAVAPFAEPCRPASTRLRGARLIRDQVVALRPLRSSTGSIEVDAVDASGRQVLLYVPHFLPSESLRYWLATPRSGQRLEVRPDDAEVQLFTVSPASRLCDGHLPPKAP